MKSRSSGLTMMKILTLSILTLFLVLISPNTALSQNVIMVDNFNDAVQSANTLGYWTGWGSSAGFAVEELYLHMYDPESSKSNNARRMTYDCAGSGDYAWHASNVWNDITPMDVTGYDYISFRLKREFGDEGCYVKIKYGPKASPIETDLLYSGNYSQDTDEWQLVNIPLSDFTGLDQASVMSIIFLFDNSLPVASGTLYVDDLEFSKGYAKEESTGPVRIDRTTKTLYVDGAPFIVKSVGYQPYPIGTWPGSLSLDEIDPGVYDRDLPLIVDMGCNAIRTWGEPSLDLLNKAEEYGLKVLAGFWIDPNSDYADPVVRGNIKSDFTDFINLRKSSSAVLIWGVGNENNYTGGFSASSYYSLANELAEIAYQEEGATYHPVIIINGGLYWIGVDEAGAGDLQLSYIDAWGSNIYAQEYAQHGWLDGTRDIFEVYKEKTAKPLVITEHGIDAFYTTQIDWNDALEKFVASAGYEDETIQADWAEANLLEIMAAADVCIGSSLMEYSDEWWKDMDGSLFDHDLGGGAWWDGNQPDNFSNEEYYGVVRIATDGTWGAADGLDDVQAREVYYRLQGIFGGGTPPPLEYLIADDYDDGDPNTNTLGYWTGGSPAMTEVTTPNFDGTQCREIQYQDVDWYASNVWDGTTYADISDYEYLTFIIKGVLGGESMAVELQYGANSISSVIFSATTTAWQEVTIPLSNFSGLDKSAIKAISMVFQGGGSIFLDDLRFGKTASPPPINQPPVVSNIPGQTIDEGGSFATITLDDCVDDPDNTDSEITWTSSGNIDLIVDMDPATRIATVSTPYIDWTGQETITFRATDPDGEYDEDAAVFTVDPIIVPGGLIVDDYNDGDIGTNSLGYWTGSDAIIADTIEGSYDGTQCRKIIWSNKDWYSSNVWDGTNYADISAYSYLSFAIKGVTGGERITIALYSGSRTTSRCSFSGATTEWQEVRIPLDDFTGLDKSRLRYIGFTFKGSATVYIDNLGFLN